MTLRTDTYIQNSILTTCDHRNSGLVSESRSAAAGSDTGVMSHVHIIECSIDPQVGSIDCESVWSNPVTLYRSVVLVPV